MRVPLRALLVIAVVAAICVGGPRVTDSDPMIAADVALLAGLLVWAVLVARETWRGWRIARALRGRTLVTEIAGVRCCVVAGGTMQAFALGILRPRIYVSERLLVEMPPRELRAVVLHEEYHRRTYAPLRAAALRSLLELAAVSRSAKSSLADRLADLEREADAFAMQLGAGPEMLAAALVRTDADVAPSGASFGAAAERRLEALLAAATGTAPQAVPLPPLEWLVPAVALLVPVACYLMGLAPLA